MIQSVTSKAEDLLQAQPASEISSKYETLSKQAKELYARQKETVEQHQAFIDSGNDFMQWIRVAKEKLSKCSEPTGDKECLSSKVSQLKVSLTKYHYNIIEKLYFKLHKFFCQIRDIVSVYIIPFQSYFYMCYQIKSVY